MSDSHMSDQLAILDRIKSYRSSKGEIAVANAMTLQVNGSIVESSGDISKSITANAGKSMDILDKIKDDKLRQRMLESSVSTFEALNLAVTKMATNAAQHMD